MSPDTPAHPARTGMAIWEIIMRSIVLSTSDTT